MELLSLSKCKFLGERQFTSKKTGEVYSRIKIADVENYETYEFFKRDDITLPADLIVGDMVTCEFELRKNGFNVNTDLVKLEKLKEI